VDLTRDSEVHGPSSPLSPLAKQLQDPEGISLGTIPTARRAPMRGCLAYENLTMLEKLDVSLVLMKVLRDVD
jgi:hypothetical protein